MIREEILTIAIPTYNRENALRKTLLKLERQTNKKFNLIILNNHSEYSVDDIIHELPKDFRDRIKLINRNINVGMDVNIMECFAYCESKWLWTLSDDDELQDDAVDKIYKYIEAFGEFGVINFTIMDDMPINKECYFEIDSIGAFNSFYEVSYKEQSKWHGDLVFISNKVFNMDVVEEYLLFSFKYIYSCIPIIVLVGKVLENHHSYIIVNDKILNSGENEKRLWNFEYVVLGTRTLMDVPFDLSTREKIDFLKYITFNIWTILYEDFINRERTVSKLFYDEIYHGIYKYILKGKRKLLLKIICGLNKSNFGRTFIRKILLMRFKETNV